VYLARRMMVAENQKKRSLLSPIGSLSLLGMAQEVYNAASRSVQDLQRAFSPIPDDPHPLGRPTEKRIEDMIVTLPTSSIAASTIAPARRKAGETILGTFAGREAKTANKSLLRRAEEASKKGAGRGEILEKTGWMKGADGKWRFEISDEAMKIVPNIERAITKADARKPPLSRGKSYKAYPNGKVTFEASLDTIVKHNDLFSAYPSLKQIRIEATINPAATKVRGNISSGYGGMVQPVLTIEANNSKNLMKGVAHELQHVIQNIEKFAAGGKATDKWYKKLAGEVEANNVINRLGMSATARQKRPPWATQAVPTSQQIIK